MCWALYLASDKELPQISWNEANPSFYTKELADYELAVREHFSHPYVVYLGSHEGCGCGFHLNGTEERKRTALELHAYLNNAASKGVKLEMFLCWEGDQGNQIAERKNLTVSDFRGDAFPLDLGQIATISPDVQDIMVCTRPLSKMERKYIADCSSGSAYLPVWTHLKELLMAVAFITFITFSVSFVFWKTVVPPAWRAALLDEDAAVCLIFVISLLVSTFLCGKWMRNVFRCLLSDKTREESPFAKDMRGGIGHSINLTVTAAYELPETEDEGVGFFLQLDDNRVLFIQGQDLCEYSRKENPDLKCRSFPSSRILYTYAPESKLRLSVEDISEEFIEPRMLMPLNHEKDTSYPEDGAFYAGDLSDMDKMFALKKET